MRYAKLLIILVAIGVARGDVIDKIKKAYNVAYDEVHCGFHKVKEFVSHHQHERGEDPCLNKPYVTGTTTTTERARVEPIERLDNPTTQATQYGWQSQ